MKRKLKIAQEKDTKIDKLTKLQFDVTQNCGTEPPFDNEFWSKKEVLVGVLHRQLR